MKPSYLRYQSLIRQYSHEHSPQLVSDSIIPSIPSPSSTSSPSLLNTIPTPTATRTARTDESTHDGSDPIKPSFTLWSVLREDLMLALHLTDSPPSSSSSFSLHNSNDPRAQVSKDIPKPAPTSGRAENEGSSEDIYKKEFMRLASVGAISALTGFFSGMFGVGGAIFALPACSLVLEQPQQAIVGTCLLGMAGPIMFGSFAHHRMGNVIWPLVPNLLVGCSLGSMAGAQLALYLSDEQQRLGFGGAMTLVMLGLIKKGF